MITKDYLEQTLHDFENLVLRKRFAIQITPELFGAVGDGIVDDTEPINHAINIASANGLPVQFAPKTYKVTISLNIVSNTKLIGHKGRTKFVTYDSSDTTTIQAIKQYNNLSNVLIQGICFDDTFTLKFESSNKITVEDCEFLNHRYTGLVLQWCNNVTIRRNKFTEIGRMISSEYPRFVKKNSNGTFTISNQDSIMERPNFGKDGDYKVCRDVKEDGTYTIDYSLGMVHQIAIIGALSDTQKTTIGTSVTGISGKFGRAIVVQGGDVNQSTVAWNRNILITENEFSKIYGIKAVSILQGLSGVEVSNNNFHDLSYGAVEFYGYNSEPYYTNIICDNSCVNIGTYKPAPNDLVGWDSMTGVGSAVGGSCFFLAESKTGNVIVTRNTIRNCAENAIEGAYKEISYNIIDTTGVGATRAYVDLLPTPEEGEKLYRYTPSYEGIYTNANTVTIHHNVFKNVPVRAINYNSSATTDANKITITNNSFQHSGWDEEQIFSEDEIAAKRNTNYTATEIHIQRNNIIDLIVSQNAITKRPKFIIDRVTNLNYGQTIMPRIVKVLKITGDCNIECSGNIVNESAWETKNAVQGTLVHPIVWDEDGNVTETETLDTIDIGKWGEIKQNIPRGFDTKGKYSCVLAKVSYAIDSIYPYTNNGSTNSNAVCVDINEKNEPSQRINYTTPYAVGDEMKEYLAIYTKCLLFETKDVSNNKTTKVRVQNPNGTEGGKIKLVDAQFKVFS